MKLEKYQENGLAYPFKLNSQFSQEKFMSEYFDFQKNQKKFLKKQALNQIYYLYFLTN